MSCRPLLLIALLASSAPVEAVAQGSSSTASPFSFAVVGHIRGAATGELNPKLAELIDRVRAEQPDFVLLTGDIIWGEVDKTPRDTAAVRRQWEAVDSALAGLGVPVFRVPGNHDISDLRTRDLYYHRYGPVPQVVERHGSRLLLLGSAWIPADGDTTLQRVTRPSALDSVQTAWLESELGRPGDWDNTFVAMHHMLWWDPAADWWRTVHPLLVRAGVGLVFAGDYGPLKFSHVTRDSVLYLQTSMEGVMQLQTLKNFERSRILSAQFDNFLIVRVNGSHTRVDVRTLGEFSSPQYQPTFYQAMMPDPPPTGWRAQVAAMATPRRLALVGLLAAVTFVLGIVVGRRSRLAR